MYKILICGKKKIKEYIKIKKMVKWFKFLEDEFELVIEWLLYFDRYWYINFGVIIDIFVYEFDIYVLSKICRVSLIFVGLCFVFSLSFC